jgi:mannosyltransferase OCH1-like enzyme
MTTIEFPKIVFQTWKTTDVPDAWKEGQRSVQAVNPDFQYVLLTDADNRCIISTYFPWYLDTYDAFEFGIQRADAIRYAVMYLWGGIYLDLDYVALRPFRDLRLRRPIGLVDTHNFARTTTNSFLVSVPRQRFWLDCLLETMKPAPWYARMFFKSLRVLETTGPNMLHRVTRRYESKDTFEKLDRVTLPCDVCALYYDGGGCTAFLPDGRKRTGYFLMPLPGASWIASDMHLANFAWCHKKITASSCICLVAVCTFALLRTR